MTATTKVGLRNGFFSFLVVLLLMPIGHSIMVLNEVLLHEFMYWGAVGMGIVGLAMLVWGIKRNSHTTFATLMGFLSAVLIWTGWVEFSFVWIANKNNVSHLMVDGEIATKAEYLVMLSSIGLLATITLYYLFSRNNCSMFVWLQRVLGFRKDIVSQSGFRKPFAVTTFSETIMIIWFFYILLLVVYDEQIAGDTHPATHLVAWGSLIWSIYLITRLFKIQTFDYAIRYAIPTVVIFWNFIEVMGRWNTFKEVWVHPLEHWVELVLFTVLLAALLTLFLSNRTFKRKGARHSLETDVDAV
ncbi:MAG: hypothetical protein J5I53_00360 [Bradyrhizobiaceae bacterium]|nr:hypothetical protein [Bradyrhizobiaceae bacterium]